MYQLYQEEYTSSAIAGKETGPGKKPFTASGGSGAADTERM